MKVEKSKLIIHAGNKCNGVAYYTEPSNLHYFLAFCFETIYKSSQKEVKRYHMNDLFKQDRVSGGKSIHLFDLF